MSSSSSSPSLFIFIIIIKVSRSRLWASVCQVHQSKTMSAAEYPFNIVKYIKKTCTVSIPARIANTIHDLFRNFWMLKPFFLDHIHNLLEPDSQVLKICNYQTPTREIYHFTYISIQEYISILCPHRHGQLSPSPLSDVSSRPS